MSSDTAEKKTWTWRAFFMVLVQGFALFSDGYNVQIIGYMQSVMAVLYPKVLTASIKTRLSNSILIGEVVGMILFGLCIDRFGRKIGVIATTCFLVFGIVLATASHGTSLTGMFWMMIVSRGIAGVGAGGEYAVCTAQALESADGSTATQKKRGLLVAISTNFSIILGFVASSIVSIIVIAAYHGKANEGIWRICFGIGIILPLGIFLFRISMIDSRQYERHAIQHKLPYKLALKMYWRPLLGCCSAWFLYDFVVYPFNLLAPTLVKGFSKKQTLLQSVGWSALINSFALPGALFGGWLMDIIGRRQTYALGWAIVSILGFIIGGAMVQLQHVFPLFVVLYGLFQTFLSVGPGDCNFLVSSESFPTPLRGHFLGFAAAVGKAGAAIGTTVLSSALSSYDDPVKGRQVIFLIGSAISVVGTLIVWFLIPNHPKELEDQDTRFRAYLEENGYDVSQIGLPQSKPQREV
ncbi:MFS general substrate transporter [Xylona heveae TC161]|uniref:MFS general substrate transporter n=1 Tax=Xylona heveae (strain CBS 132557 / TC161) TaxID=1328760 RepID=A0A165FPR1_XYLHT|nr:MFS general substrate transporter [Xylona heveae TC161]KZF21236.1 MFS general substrate transporter [Xylona heveae TC161]